MEKVKITLLIIFIFTAGFVTSQLFFTPTPAQYLTDKENTSDVNAGSEENPKSPHEEVKLIIKDVNRHEGKISQLESESFYENTNSRESNAESSESRSTTFASMTIEDAEAILPKPYSDIVASTGGTMIEILNEHLNDEVDYDWASNMEQKFRDFIYLHPLTAAIELQSIICKKSTCELMIIELEDFTWAKISLDMRKEDWYSFYGGTSQTTADSKNYIYEMLSKT